MKDESQQQVPPGIVAFKKDGIILHRPHNWSYAEWAENWLTNGGIIHTISVDGKEYSVKGTYKWKEYVETIESFNYGNGAWWFIGKDEKGYTHQLVSELSEPPSLDRSVSQPGKEMKIGIIGAGPEAIAESARAMLSRNPQPSQLGEGKEDQNRMIIERMLFPQPPLTEQEGHWVPCAERVPVAKEVRHRKIGQTQEQFGFVYNEDAYSIREWWADYPAIKSRSSERWSDLDLKEAFEYGCRYVESSGFAPNFNQWLSSYKAKQK